MNDYWDQNDPAAQRLMGMNPMTFDALRMMRRTAGMDTGLAGQAASMPAPPGMMGQMAGGMKDYLTSPLGMIGAGVQLATTDFDDPKSIGGSVGGIAGQAAGASLGSQMAALGSIGGPVGAAVGGLVGTLGGSALGGLFGDDKEEEARKEAERQAEMDQLRHNMMVSGQYLQQRNQARLGR